MGINWESKVLSSVGNVIDNAQHISVSEKHIETVADCLAYEEFGLPKNNQTNKIRKQSGRTNLKKNEHLWKKELAATPYHRINNIF